MMKQVIDGIRYNSYILTLFKNDIVKGCDLMNNIIKNVDNYEEFKKVFSVFSGAPFFEKWTEDKLKYEYDYLKKDGEIYGYYLDNHEIIGLVSIVFGAIKNHPLIFKNPEKTIYLSDIAVIYSQRGNGYAKKLADFIINYVNKINYYDEIYMRTNLEGSMSEKIFLERGFNIIRDENNNIVTQDVSFERTDGIIKQDTRKFLSKRLELK